MRGLLLFLLVVIPCQVLAYGPPLNLPDGNHPRIILTDVELARLEAKRATANADWIALEAWCDTHLNDAGYDIGRLDWDGNNAFAGYRMSGYAKYLTNFSLAYQTLKQVNPVKAATYAAYVKNILIDGIYIGMRSGEENNGLKALRCGETTDRTINAAETALLGLGTSVSYKLGYGSRNVAAVPIAYDWIYDTLNSDDRLKLEAMMFRWYDWIRGVRTTYNNGVLISGTRYHEDTTGSCSGTDNCTTWTGASQKAYAFGDIADNFMGGHTYLMALIPAVTYGSNSDATAYLTDFKEMLATTVLGPLNSEFKHGGGDSVEGWNYGGGYVYTLPGLYGYYTATGDPSISSSPWSTQLVKATVHRLGPNLIDVPIYGEWTGTPLGANRLAIASTFIGVEQRLHPETVESGLGQYLLNNVTFNSTADLWQHFLWKRSDITPINPASEPLSHTAQGNGFFTSRSSWANAAGTVFASIRLEGKSRGGHEVYDEGHLSIQRGSDRLLVHQNLAPDATAHNTVVFNNLNHYTLNPALTALAISRTAENTDYSYVSGDISNAYLRQYQTARALLFKRSQLHIRPGIFVIYDITRSNSALGNEKGWFTNYGAATSVSDETITATVGVSRVFTKALYPTGGTFTETNPAAGFYRVKYTPATTQEYDQFLHVIEATGSTSPQTATVLISGVGGRGALINGDTIAMFTDNQIGTDITNLSYAANTSAPSTHYIADLIPGATYNVSIDSGAFTPYVASPAGLIVFTNPVFSPHTYSISLDGETPGPDTTAPTTTASPSQGTYTSTQTVSLTANEPATIYYTLNGSTPTTGSSVYTVPLTISTTTTLKYFARDTAGNSEAVKTSVYTIGTQPSFPLTRARFRADMR